jgi:hypothetical protein
MEKKVAESFGLSRWDFLKVAVAGVGATALSLMSSEKKAFGASQGAVMYDNGSGTPTDAASFYYDATNARVGIGTTTPKL